MNNKELVYHYTTINTLCELLNGIEHKPDAGIGSDKIEYYFLKFHASNSMFLDDPTENKLYIDALSEIFSDNLMFDFAKIVSNLLIGAPYVISLSELSDDLNMWRNYTDDAHGVALGFELNKSTIKDANSKLDDIQFLNCEYTTKEKLIETIKSSDEYLKIKNDLDSILNDRKVRIDNIERTIIQNCLVYKDIAYQSEKERRLAIFAHFDSKFKSRKNEIVNYKEIFIPLSALKQITFAPLANFNKINYSVSKMIREKISPNVNIDIEISKSKIPYSGKQ